MATFIDGVNRLLRINSIIKGDDDNITTFDDTQHAAYIELAQIAIQDELTSLVSDRLIPYEKTSASITLVEGTRVYALASDFIRFFGSRPSFYDSVDNVRSYELRGGEDDLRDTDYKYKETKGNPWAWYWDSTTSKKVAFYQIPEARYDSRSIEYDYEKSVTVINSSDTLPFHNNEEYYSFISMSARRFKYLVGESDIGALSKDPVWVGAKSTLYELMSPVNPPKYYGRRSGNS